VVLAMSRDLARAAERARALLEEGTAVTLVVACRRCGMAGVELLAGLRLAARRTGTRLDIVVEDESLRALVALAGLTDLLDE
jgi:ABC-type transporter Mla MlaB component